MTLPPSDTVAPVSEPHIGHLHSMVLADVFTRFRALRNGPSAPRPILLTGTDEHGMKIQKAAQNQNLTPRALCDSVSTRFEVGEMLDSLYRHGQPITALTILSFRLWQRLRASSTTSSIAHQPKAMPEPYSIYGCV